MREGGERGERHREREKTRREREINWENRERWI